MLSRDEAEKLMREQVNNPNMESHCLAVAAVMEKLAVKLDQDPELWYLTGLLHDVDYEFTRENPDRHGLVAMEILAPYDLPDEMLHAIRSHAGNDTRESILDRGIWAADPITGLIIAAALMRPEKKISAIPLKSLKKKYKSKAFAAGASREQIASCSDLGIELADFLQLSLDAMGEVEDQLLS